MNKNIKGFFTYKGLLCQQHEDIIEPFIDFITRVKPAQILEIGTGGGGFIMFINDIILRHKIKCHVRSYDIQDWHYDRKVLLDRGINYINQNVFNHNYNRVEYKEIPLFIQRPGTTVVFCDGGCKINEFNLLSPFLKKGDYIFVHDYCKDRETFKNEFYGKVWNWCEITDEDIKLDGLEKVEGFDKVVWGAFHKT